MKRQLFILFSLALMCCWLNVGTASAQKSAKTKVFVKTGDASNYHLFKNCKSLKKIEGEATQGKAGEIGGGRSLCPVCEKKQAEIEKKKAEKKAKKEAKKKEKQAKKKAEKAEKKAQRKAEKQAEKQAEKEAEKAAEKARKEAEQQMPQPQY